MKNIHFILAALLLLGITSCSSTGKNKEANDSTQVAAIAEDTAAAEVAAPTELSEAAQQEIKAKKAFLETFYDGLDESGFDDAYIRKFITPTAKKILNENYDYAYIRKFITPNAKKILNENYDYDCDDNDCLAVWLFAYEAGGDTGKCLSRTIKEQDENHFLVTLKYEEEEYNVLLTVIKDGDAYKIDDIEKK